MEQWSNVDLPVCILDNHFDNPDLERYIGRFEEYQPEVAIVGDAYTADEAVLFQDVIDDLQQEYTDTEYVVVAKCSECFAILDPDIVLGYPMGYSDSSR